MSEKAKSLSEELGIDQSAEEALARANVRTLAELSKAEPEALAMASGIPVDRIREWQKRAQRAGAPRRRSPVATGWAVAVIGLIVALLIGWLMMSVGTRKLAAAEQFQREAEARLQMEVAFGARKAMDGLRPVRLAMHNENWGQASSAVSGVEDCIEFVKRVAPPSGEADVRKVSESLEGLKSAIEGRSRDAMERLTELEAALDKLSSAE